VIASVISDSINFRCVLYSWLRPEGVIYSTLVEICEFSLATHGQVLVVANPANTNALILKEFAPSIPEKNITCLTRLDHNRALGQVAERLGVAVSSVKNVIIWGNHSSSQYPDVNHAVVEGPDGVKSVRSAVADDAWYVL
jgi:malate dehydrogenase